LLTFADMPILQKNFADADFLNKILPMPIQEKKKFADNDENHQKVPILADSDS
jgi:hypothetical protein